MMIWPLPKKFTHQLFILFKLHVMYPFSMKLLNLLFSLNCFQRQSEVWNQLGLLVATIRCKLPNVESSENAEKENNILICFHIPFCVLQFLEYPERILENKEDSYLLGIPIYLWFDDTDSNLILLPVIRHSCGIVPVIGSTARIVNNPHEWKMNGKSLNAPVYGSRREQLRNSIRKSGRNRGEQDVRRRRRTRWGTLRFRRDWWRTWSNCWPWQRSLPRWTRRAHCQLID